jgi:hypothetical protein
MAQHYFATVRIEDDSGNHVFKESGVAEKVLSKAFIYIKNKEGMGLWNKFKTAVREDYEKWLEVQ